MGKTALIAIAAVAAGLQMGCSSVLTTSNSARAGLFKCGDSGDCRTGVYVSVGDDGDCIVQVLVEKVTIGQGKRPKVVWHLEKADPEGDRFKYQFEPTLGIVIVGNNPTQDFESPVADGKGFGAGAQCHHRARKENGDRVEQRGRGAHRRLGRRYGHR